MDRKELIKHMDNMYQISIDFVSGDIGVSMYSQDKKKLLEFLEKYDHEGSCINLEIHGNNDHNITEEYNNPELIYKFLKEE